MSDEEQSLRHRRASEATAGVPSAAARAAIRREAEVQDAARRAATGAADAANDSYWPLRAVAGLAVIAIAAGLWWQLRPEAAEVGQLAQVDEVARIAESKAQPQAPAPASAAAPAPQPPPVAVMKAQSAAERQSPTAPVVSVAAELPSSPLATQLADAIALRLPEAWNSATPVDGLWVRLDAQGKVVDAGNPTAARGLARMAAAATGEVAATAAADTRAFSDRATNTAQAAPTDDSVELLNARGVPLRISVRRDPAAP
jgi:hypothetical protein